MLLFRAMNEYDVIIDPLKNGFALKKIIYDNTKRYLYNTNRKLIEKLSPNHQLKELERLKNIILSNVKEENNSYMLYVFDELYLKNHNILDITINSKEKEKMLLMRNEIISKSQYLPSALIKRKK